MRWEKPVPTSFVSDSGDSPVVRGSDKRGLTVMNSYVVAGTFL